MWGWSFGMHIYFIWVKDDVGNANKSANYYFNTTTTAVVTLNYHTNTTNITGIPHSQMSIGESLYYNGTFTSTEDETIWVNADIATDNRSEDPADP